MLAWAGSVMTAASTAAWCAAGLSGFGEGPAGRCAGILLALTTRLTTMLLGLPAMVSRTGECWAEAAVAHLGSEMGWMSTIDGASEALATK